MNYVNLYTNFLKRFLKSQRHLRVIFDCSNGTAGLVIKKLLKPNPPTGEQNLKPIFINEKPSGNFSAHGPNPLKPGATAQLQKEVKKNKSDLGIIFDADGDRAFFIDNRGRFIDPDIIIRLLIWHLKPKKVVIGVRTGWLVKRFKTYDLRLMTSKVGHYFFKKLMRQKNADFGAERSGHYYFKISDPKNPNYIRMTRIKSKSNKKLFYLGSGILAAIEVINAVSKLPYSLADFVDLLPRYFRFTRTYADWTRTDAENNTERSRRIKKILKKIETELKDKSSKLKARVSHLDGLTIEYEDYWFNIRPSNTEPLIRLSIETKSKKVLQREKKKLTALLKKM